MLNIRKSKFLALFLSALILFTSCNNDSLSLENSSTPKKETSTKLNLTGEDYFKAIFFSEGVLAKQIPALKPMNDFLNTLTEEQRIVYLNFQSDLIDSLKSKNENYFSTFKEKMTSNNLYIIDSYLQTVSKDVEDFAYSQTDKTKTEINEIVRTYKNDIGFDANPKEGTCFGSVALVIVVVIVISIAINLTYQYTKVQSSPDPYNPGKGPVLAALESIAPDAPEINKANVIIQISNL